MKKVLILFIILISLQVAYALNTDRVKIYFLSGDYISAISEGENMLLKDEDSSELRYLLGVSYLKEGNYQKSAFNFRAVINNFKDNRFKDESRIGLADTYLLRGDFNNARNLYNEIINENPKIKFKEAILSRLRDMELKAPGSMRDDVKTGYYSVQVGSFSNINNAKNLTRKLVSEGYPAYMEGSNPPYRVKVGRLSARVQAEELSKELSRKGHPIKICPQ